ncbi:hypothetical protein PsalN5692_03415 [Piscirickettsia salmonis]|nr:hypothetical protein PsalN5692_03415 [Piscirickettsia salmonis]
MQNTYRGSDAYGFYLAESQLGRNAKLELINCLTLPYSSPLEVDRLAILKKSLHYLKGKKIILAVKYQDVVERRSKISRLTDFKMHEGQALSYIAKSCNLPMDSFYTDTSLCYTNENSYFDLVAVSKAQLYSRIALFSKLGLSVFAVNIDVYALFDLCKKLLVKQSIDSGLVIYMGEESCSFYLLDDHRICFEPVHRSMTSKDRREENSASVVDFIYEVIESIFMSIECNKIENIFLFGINNKLIVNRANVYNMSGIIEEKFSLVQPYELISLSLSLSYKKL